MPGFGPPAHIDRSVSDAGAGARWCCEVIGLHRQLTALQAAQDTAQDTANRAALVCRAPEGIQRAFRWTGHANI